ncbi:MAG: hypothetical protein AB8B65_15085 [Kordia sp.]|uniref:hypothetical protein n=1 Tax=Kordia sp. TaxID=1965332 RepID=UPI00385E8F44
MNTKDWTETEKAQYKSLYELANYIYKKEKKAISKDTLFSKHIYFDYVLKDTIAKRKEGRIKKFDTLFYYFRQRVDSIGLENLDAKPIRFYKNHEIYKPFKEELSKQTVGGKKMVPKSDNVFVYFRKEEPDKPLGRLLFDPNTHKLVAWVMLNQGGHNFFLTFNLL